MFRLYRADRNPQRCLWGSDFPFVMDHLPSAAPDTAAAGEDSACAAESGVPYEPYVAAPLALAKLPSFASLSAANREAIMGGNAARLFGFGAPGT